MNGTRTRHLGGTATVGPAASGSRYVSRTHRTPHTACWMELVVFETAPTVPSLAGTRVQSLPAGLGASLSAGAAAAKRGLMASTMGAGEPVGGGPIRIGFELFDDESPVACENFRGLCAGANNTDTDSVNSMGRTAAPWQGRSDRYHGRDVVPSYKGTSISKIIPGFAIQGGDLTMRLLPTTTGEPSLRSANQFSGCPARLGVFADENKKRRHNAAGLLSMANTGPNTNGTQFFITTSGGNEQAFNGRHVCFGRVTEGLGRLLSEVAPHGDVLGRPSRYVVVVGCGEGPLPDLDPFAFAEEEEVGAGEETIGAVDASPSPCPSPSLSASSSPSATVVAPAAAVVAATAPAPAPAAPAASTPPLKETDTGSVSAPVGSRSSNGPARAPILKPSGGGDGAKRAPAGASIIADTLVVEDGAAAATAADGGKDVGSSAASPVFAADGSVTAGELMGLRSSLKTGPVNVKKRVTIQL